MSNLFSIFDPYTFFFFSLNWLSLFILFFILPYSYWFIFSRFEWCLLKFIQWIFDEFKVILMKKNSFNLIIMISLMLMIMIINFSGLFPYIFTSSSHMVFSLTFSLVIWFMLMIYGWLNHMNKMFIHLLPLGTPVFLMSFMILIETISNIIRPLTLAIRLSANMIAGHLLLSLIGGTGVHLSMIMLMIVLVVQIALFILEMAVSLIQSYVFSVLSTLYMGEIN